MRLDRDERGCSSHCRFTLIAQWARCGCHQAVTVPLGVQRRPLALYKGFAALPGSLEAVDGIFIDVDVGCSRRCCVVIAAMQRGRWVYYGTLVDLITSLEKTQVRG